MSTTVAMDTDLSNSPQRYTTARLTAVTIWSILCRPEQCPHFTLPNTKWFFISTLIIQYQFSRTWWKFDILPQQSPSDPKQNPICQVLFKITKQIVKDNLSANRKSKGWHSRLVSSLHQGVSYPPCQKTKTVNNTASNLPSSVFSLLLPNIKPSLPLLMFSASSAERM